MELGQSPLTLAVQLGAVRGLPVLLRAQMGELIPLQDEHGASALHYACAMDRPAVLELLLASVDQDSGLLGVEDKRGYTPLHVAAHLAGPATAGLIAAQLLIGWMKT